MVEGIGMFRNNDKHLQWPLFSSIDSLPQKQQQRLEQSWAGTFYHQFFCRIDEQPFAILYSEQDSRPNTPVNVLVGFETLKAGFGWSDEEAYDHFCFDVQVRYALGYRDLSEGHFDLRTVYNFRQRVTQHMQETGENLIERVFEQVTDEQIAAFHVQTSKTAYGQHADCQQHPPSDAAAVVGRGAAADAADAGRSGSTALW
jgi:hypothetical protein